ncbi:SDR family NAD(P)-dependent oxidoreductase [Streptomyces sp. NPDC047009]|uniref:SDR family NAD(P)-dependent oxidoreductase n=1 Tax=Streptomyces sp. NPDC047009 TaxID=3154496 RepID=UPI0033E0F32C
MELKGAVVLVTGAGGGLGQATARMLLERGARVAALDLDAPDGAPGDGLLPLTADIRLAAEVDSAFAETVRVFGRLDAVVHCAGTAGGFRLLGKDGPAAPERFRRIVDVNLLGTFHVLRASAWHMSRNERNDGDGTERGVIVTTASVAAFEGQQGQLAYAASKAGVVGMTLPAARELAEHRIRCVSIAPGAFETTLTTDLPSALQDQLISSAAYPRRLGRPEEFADLACAVLTNKMLNGEVIRLDAGTRLPQR